MDIGGGEYQKRCSWPTWPGHITRDWRNWQKDGQKQLWKLTKLMLCSSKQMCALIKHSVMYMELQNLKFRFYVFDSYSGYECIWEMRLQFWLRNTPRIKMILFKPFFFKWYDLSRMIWCQSLSPELSKNVWDMGEWILVEYKPIGEKARNSCCFGWNTVGWGKWQEYNSECAHSYPTTSQAVKTTHIAFSDAIASPSTYPGQSVGRWVTDW